jgi:hypothetical protein
MNQSINREETPSKNVVRIYNPIDIEDITVKVK